MSAAGDRLRHATSKEMAVPVATVVKISRRVKSAIPSSFDLSSKVAMAYSGPSQVRRPLAS